MYMAEVNRRKAYSARHRGMGVRDWERQQRAMGTELVAGKWWNHDRGIMYAFGIIVRADFALFLNLLPTSFEGYTDLFYFIFRLLVL